MPKQGFLRTPVMARFWWRQLQIDAHRNGEWTIAWNGHRLYVCIAGVR